MRQKRFAQIADSWNIMVENARPIVASLGPVSVRHQALETHFQSLVRANERAEEMTSELASVMTLRRELVLEGAKLYRRFTADLKAHHGLDSPELIRYGLKPTGRPRKASRELDEAAAKAKETDKVDIEVAPA
jgi:hypothetical protein